MRTNFTEMFYRNIRFFIKKWIWKYHQMVVILSRSQWVNAPVVVIMNGCCSSAYPSQITICLNVALQLKTLHMAIHNPLWKSRYFQHQVSPRKQVMWEVNWPESGAVIVQAIWWKIIQQGCLRWNPPTHVTWHSYIKVIAYNTMLVTLLIGTDSVCRLCRSISIP